MKTFCSKYYLDFILSFVAEIISFSLIYNLKAETVAKISAMVISGEVDSLQQCENVEKQIEDEVQIYALKRMIMLQSNNNCPASEK